MTAWVILHAESRPYEKWFNDLPKEVFRSLASFDLGIVK
jgi:hypothetical protein